MMTNIASARTLQRTRSLRTIAVVGADPRQHGLQAIMAAVEHDVVFVQSIAHAYSEIKRVQPSLVILCLSSDDPDACQVLSMLMLDSETSRIPVVTCITPSDAFADDAARAAEVEFNHAGPLSLN